MDPFDLMYLFDATPFTPRGACGGWSASMQAVSQIADAMVATAYFFIPASLFWLWHRKRRDWHGMWIILMFCAFIILCGITHVCQVLSFHWPAYRFFTAMTMATGIVSLATAVLLPWLLTEALKTPSLGDTIRELADVNHDRRRLETELAVERRVRHTTELQMSADRARILELERTLGEVRNCATRQGDSAITAAVQAAREIGNPHD